MATVSDTNTETTLQLYANPLLIQDKQLSLFEQHVFDGKSVLDGNNVFTFGLEMGATLAAGIVNEMANSFQSLYPARAQTMSDLYRHLSDYDYVDMYSTPAETSVELLFERNFLIDNAPADKDEEGSFKIVIPEFSTFTIGEHKFGIHYPIEIKLRKAYKSDGVTVDYDKCMFHCIWNTDTVNPLYRLTTNILEHRMYQRGGLHFLCISIPIHQFTVDIKKEDSVSSTGFIKRYQYTNRFYAIRIFHHINNQWVEIAETLSDVIYNPQVLTANVKVLSDIKTIEVSIPQSYFTAGIVGNRIMCMIYTTEGAINVDIRNYSIDQFDASFLIDDTIIDDTYSAFLKRIPYLQILPLSTRISSGSNGKTFEEMKNRVMNSIGGDDLLVTPKQLEAHLKDIGFKISRYVDNVTDRIYIASKEITDGTGSIIGAGNFMTTIDNKMLGAAWNRNNGSIDIGNYEYLRKLTNTSYMIMPPAIFRYDEATDSMIMLDNAERKKLLYDSNGNLKLDTINSATYTYTPFHIKLVTDNELPMAGAFDLMKPIVSNVTFKAENKATSSQVSMYGNVIQHVDNGAGGYKLTVVLYKSDDLNSVSIINGVEASSSVENIIVLLRTHSSVGSPIFLKGEYIGLNEEGKEEIEFNINTNYIIDSNDTIDVGFSTISENVVTSSNNPYVFLTQDYELLFFADKSVVANAENALTESNSQSNIPRSVIKNNMVWLATQSMTIKLGESISSLRTNVFMTLTGKQYESYPSTEFATYASDVYDRYLEDVMKDGKVIHEKGELKLDENGKPIIKKYAGEVIVTKTESDAIGVRNPACILKRNVTNNSSDDNKYITQNNVDLLETLYVNTDNMTPRADPSNHWYPFRTVENNDNTYSAIFTGNSKTATIITVKDMFKWIIDSIRADEANLIKNTASERFRTTNGSKLNSPIPGSVLYIIDDYGDFSNPKHWLYTKTEAGESTITLETITGDLNRDKYVNERTYVLTEDTTFVSEKTYYTRSGSGTTASPYEYTVATVTVGASVTANTYYEQMDHIPYAAVYIRDSKYSILDYEQYGLSEETVCALFDDITDMEQEIGFYKSANEIKEAYGLSDSLYEELKRFRDPWIKILETKSDIQGQNETSGIGLMETYWNNRSYMNFDADLKLKTHKSNELWVHGLKALAYLQERSSNPNIIEKFEVHEGQTAEDVQTEAIAKVDNVNDMSYRLVWVDSYDKDADNTIAINDKTGTHYDPLISAENIDTSHNEKVGALLWGSHSSETPGHYVVITGPSFIKCYNKLMEVRTMSGYIYEASVCNVQSSDPNKKIQITVNSDGYLCEPTEATDPTVNPTVITDISEAALTETIANKFLYTHSINGADNDNVVSRYVAIVGDITTTKFSLLFSESLWNEQWPWENESWFVDKDDSLPVGSILSDNGVELYLDKNNKDAKILHYAGDIQLGNDGLPIEPSNSDNERHIVYHVNMLHCDYRMVVSNQAEYKMYVYDIQELLRNYFNILENTRSLLLERTNLYFDPIKSIGYGDFKGANGEIESRPLEIAIKLRVYISPSTGGNSLSKELIKSNITNIVEKHISSGNISCTILAEQIRQQMSDVVLFVDVLGINGEIDVQTLVSSDTNKSAVHLKPKLVMNEDNTISVERSVDIEWAILQ